MVSNVFHEFSGSYQRAGANSKHWDLFLRPVEDVIFMMNGDASNLSTSTAFSMDFIHDLSSPFDL